MPGSHCPVEDAGVNLLERPLALGAFACRPRREGLPAVTQSVSNGYPPKLVVAQAVEGQIDDLVNAAAERAIIERATGMLMLAYDLDADNSAELLKWGSQVRDMGVPQFARQLAEDFAAGCEPADLRVMCDEVLFGRP